MVSAARKRNRSCQRQPCRSELQPAYTDPDSHGDSYGYFYASHADTHAYCHCNGYCNSYGYCGSERNSYSYSDRYTDCNCNRDSHSSRDHAQCAWLPSAETKHSRPDLERGDLRHCGHLSQ